MLAPVKTLSGQDTYPRARGHGDVVTSRVGRSDGNLRGRYDHSVIQSLYERASQAEEVPQQLDVARALLGRRAAREPVHDAGVEVAQLGDVGVAGVLIGRPQLELVDRVGEVQPRALAEVLQTAQQQPRALPGRAAG